MVIKRVSVKLSDGRTVEFNKFTKLKDMFAFLSLNLMSFSGELFSAFRIAEHSNLTTQEVLEVNNNDIKNLESAFCGFVCKNLYNKELNENVFELNQGLKIGGIKYNQFVFEGFADASIESDVKKLGKMEWVMPYFAITKEVVQIRKSNKKDVFNIRLQIEDLEEMLFIEAMMLEDFANQRRGFSFPLWLGSESGKGMAVRQ